MRDEITEQLVPIKEQIDQVAALVTPRPQTIVVGGTLQIWAYPPTYPSREKEREKGKKEDIFKTWKLYISYIIYTN